LPHFCRTVAAHVAAPLPHRCRTIAAPLPHLCRAFAASLPPFAFFAAHFAALFAALGTFRYTF
jgi:hypothetical protein